MERENAWKSYTDQDKTELTELCEGYKSFLSQCKTERLAPSALSSSQAKRAMFPSQRRSLKNVR